MTIKHGLTIRSTSEIQQLLAELDELRAVLEREGYRRCDVPACNCGGWHRGDLGAPPRNGLNITTGQIQQEQTYSWAVTVERNGENVVRLESQCYGGRELSAADKTAIRTAAAHLVAFVVPTEEPSL